MVFCDIPTVYRLFTHGIAVGIVTGAIGLLLGLATIVSPTPRIALNEYMAVPDADGVEFLELLVGGTSPISADRISISDATANWRRLPSSAGLFTAGQYVVVVPDSATFMFKHGPIPDHASLVELRPWPTLNNGGDSILVAVDDMLSDRAGWTGGDVVRGTSRERVAVVLPGRLSDAWATSTTPPGTPGRRNATHRDDDDAPRIVGVEWAPPDRFLVWLDEPVHSDGARIADASGTGGLQPLPLHCPAVGVQWCPTLTATLSTEWGSILSSGTAEGEAVFIEIQGITDLWGNEAGASRDPVHVPPAPGGIMISEIMTRGQPEFVEMVVDAPTPVTLRHTTLRTSRAEYALAPVEGTLLLAPDDVYVVEVDLLTTGDSILLIDAAVSGDPDVTIDSVQIHPDLEDPRFRSHVNRSLRRVGGAARDWASSLSPASTPGSDPDRELRRRAAPPMDPQTTSPNSSTSLSNLDPGTLPLVLTEVMYDPLMDPQDNRTDQTLFLEWTNQGPSAVEWFGSHLLFETDERGDRDSLHAGYQPFSLLPGHSLVLAWVPPHVDDMDVEDKGRMRNFLSGIWPETPIALRVQPTRRSLGLRNAGRELTLVAGDGRVLAVDTYGPERHHPMVPETKGRSLERRRLSTGWSHLETSSHVDGATPGWVAGTAAETSRDATELSAHLEPRSFYPDHPELGASTHVVLNIPPNMGVRPLSLAVFSRLGHPVRHLVETRPVSGITTVRWDGFDDSGTLVPAGIYFVVISLDDTPAWRVRLPVAVLRR